MGQMTKILVTGSTGFLGRNIKEQFASDFEIFAPSHQELDLLNANGIENFL